MLVFFCFFVFFLFICFNVESLRSAYVCALLDKWAESLEMILFMLTRCQLCWLEKKKG